MNQRQVWKLTRKTIPYNLGNLLSLIATVLGQVARIRLYIL